MLNTQKYYRRKSARPEIFVGHEWFSKTLLSMGTAVIATDQKGVVTSMNKVAEELTGWKMSQSSGKPIDNIFDAINENTRLPVENPIKVALRENRALLLANHTILIKKDKTQRIIVDSAVPIHDAHSEIIGGALIFRDVTELSVSKKKLVESEGMLKGILENTGSVIDIKDIEGKYLLINRQEEKIYRIKESRLIGKNSAKHLSMDEISLSKRTDTQVIKRKRLIKYNQVIKHPDGTYHCYHTSKFPLFDSENKVYAVCTVSTDISESIKNIGLKEKPGTPKADLKDKIRHDELTESMPNMFFSLNRSFKHTSFNKACEKFTGVKAEKVMGKTMEEAFPDVAPLFLAECKEVMKTGKTKNFISTFLIDGNSFSHIVNIYPTQNGVSVLMTDLSLQKRSELETLELVDNLQQKNKDLRRFASVVSHDLRAPIAKVLQLISLAEIDPEFKIDDKTILQSVANEVTNLDNVVKDMNSTIARDGVKQKEYVAFETELKLIKKVLENMIVDSMAVITTDFKKPEGMLTVKSYFYSILYNLLSNALKYRAHGVALTVHIQTNQDKEFVCLSVKDNGMGIDMKKYGDKVFGLYNRFHGKKIEGNGIGLSLVKAQAESLGGKVEVESEVNHGSTFKIFLPLNHK